MAKKPDYRLEALFGIREKEKEDAELVYAEKQRLLAVEEKKLEEMKEHLREMARAREAKKLEYAEKMRSGELNINAINANDRHLERMKQEEAAYMVEIQRQSENVTEAEDEVEKAKEAMLKASQEFKALEKHKEKWAKGVKRERDMKEAETADEIAQAQYLARMREEREE